MEASNDEDHESPKVAQENKASADADDTSCTSNQSISSKPKSNSAHDHIPPTSHRMLFNNEAFGLRPDLTVEQEPGKSSPQLTPKKWEMIIDVLKHWGPQDNDGNYINPDLIEDEDEKKRVKEHRKANRLAYEWCKTYNLEEYIETSNQKESYRLRRKKCGRIALPMHQVFDALSDIHVKTSHSGRDSTYGELSKEFCNITQKLCLLFIKLFPVCRLVTTTQPAAKKTAKKKSVRTKPKAAKKRKADSEVASEQSSKKHRPSTGNKKTIVISGVTSGLGRGLLEYYYLQGHRIVGCARTTQDVNSLSKLFPQATLSVVNVASDMEVAAWAQDLCGKLGVDHFNNSERLEVDIVIANARVSSETAHENRCAWQISRVDFDATLDINIKGVSNMIQHFVPIMIDNAKNQKNPSNKCFVAMSSGLGRSPNPYHTAYCASKWAIEGMIKSLAMSLPE
ncbi:hypothetical protein ACHAXN_006786 [Cyclotella atomus]